MTISTTTNRATYTGNGATVDFSFPYAFFAKADLVVIETVIATGVQTTKTLTTHYTISGSVDALGHYSSGGTVTALTAPASTVTWTIYRDPAATQTTDLVENDPMPAESIEAALDYQTMLNQRTRDIAARSLQQPEGDSATIDRLPAKVDRASKYLAFDADGDPVATAGTTSAYVVTPFMETVLDDTTAATARATLGAIGDTIMDAKGDLIAASAAGTPAKLTAGVDGLFLGTDSSQSTGLKWTLAALPCQFRLTLVSGSPVPTTDQTAKTTLYWTPYGGNLVALYDGTRWVLRATAELSVAVPATTTTMYDVFVYDNAGTPTLELTAWTNDTTRATALVFQNGIYVKSGAVTRRYVGSFRTTGVSGQTEDSLATRYVWNYYHRVTQPMKAVDTTDSWTYTTNTIRQANANTANQLDYVCGVSEDAVEATVAGLFNNGNSAKAAVYIGVDSTTANSAQIYGGLRGDTGSAHYLQPHAHYRGYPGVGRHYLTWLESSVATGTTTWYGDNGAGDQQSGIVGSLRG